MTSGIENTLLAVQTPRPPVDRQCRAGSGDDRADCDDARVGRTVAGIGRRRWRPRVPGCGCFLPWVMVSAMVAPARALAQVRPDHRTRRRHEGPRRPGPRGSRRRRTRDPIHRAGSGKVEVARDLGARAGLDLGPAADGGPEVDLDRAMRPVGRSARDRPAHPHRARHAPALDRDIRDDPGRVRFGPARSCFAPSPGGAGSRPGRASNPYRGRPARAARRLADRGAARSTRGRVRSRETPA